MLMLDRAAQRELKTLNLPSATKWLSRFERALLPILDTGPGSAKLPGP